MVALGDSITEGTIHSLPEIRESYPALLQHDLGSGWRVMNLGVSGSTTEMVSKVWKRKARKLRSSTAVVFVGVNDLRWGWSAERSWTFLRTTYEEILADGMTLVAVTVTPFRGSDAYANPWTPEKQLELDKLNRRIRDFCRSPGCTLVDAYREVLDAENPYAITRAFDYGDHLHLSQAGLSRLATRVRAAIQQSSDPRSSLSSSDAAP